MLLVTLEGLPHSGRCAVLRNLVQRCPDWAALNVLPEAPASASAHLGYVLFASLMRKVQALHKCARPGGVVLLNTPWFEHLARHQALWGLFEAMTRELVTCLRSSVHTHAMVMLRVPYDETFEQMVCCNNPFWNSTTLADVLAAQRIITAHMHTLPTSGEHPFPCKTVLVECPPFFEENEVVVEQVVAQIVAHVQRAQAQQS